MIGGPGPTPNLLRQYELGKVPAEMPDGKDREPGHDRSAKNPVRRWWRRLFRRH